MAIGTARRMRQRERRSGRGTCRGYGIQPGRGSRRTECRSGMQRRARRAGGLIPARDRGQRHRSDRRGDCSHQRTGSHMTSAGIEKAALAATDRSVAGRSTPALAELASSAVPGVICGLSRPNGTPELRAVARLVRQRAQDTPAIRTKSEECTPSDWSRPESTL